MKRTVEEHFRTLCIVWAVLLLSQFMFVFVLSQAKAEVFKFDPSEPVLGKAPAFVIGLALLAIVNLIMSHVIKRRCFLEAVERKKTQLVQTGIIIACAFCEAISIFGMVLAFAFSYQYFFLWFLLGILGIFSHIPRRKDLYAAVGM
jgi:F0F1-type ATP synthase membrane subunit c/vacuolar-type H+-ATPase subunit K